jgi:hypothetical protein
MKQQLGFRKLTKVHPQYLRPTDVGTQTSHARCSYGERSTYIWTLAKIALYPSLESRIFDSQASHFLAPGVNTSNIGVNYLIFNEMGESILEPLGKHTGEAGSGSNHLRDLVTNLRNITILVRRNEQTSGDLWPVVESAAFVAAVNKITTNPCDAARSSRIVREDIRIHDPFGTRLLRLHKSRIEWS